MNYQITALRCASGYGIQFAGKANTVGGAGNSPKRPPWLECLAITLVALAIGITFALQIAP